MAERYYKTNDVAKAVNVHNNTIRLYETLGFLPQIPRGENGYRLYTEQHMQQAILARLVLQWPYVGDKARLEDLVRSAAAGDLGMAMELAYQYLATVRMERTLAEAGIEFLERWAAGHLIDSSRQRMNIGEAAQYLNVTVDMLRNWERNGLISIPRDPANNYRLYGTAEYGRLRVIRTLVKSGYSLMAILQMLLQFDAGKTENLREALDLPVEADEPIWIIADRWLSSLIDLEARAKEIIRQIGHMMEMAHRHP